METIERLLITYLANAAWMTCVISAAAILLAKLIHHGPSAYRHALWVLALAFASLLPLTSLRNTGIVAGETATVSKGDTDADTSVRGAAQKSSGSSFWLKMHRGKRPVAFTPLLTEIGAAGYLAFLIYQGLCLYWAWIRTRSVLRRAFRCSFTPGLAAVVRRCCSAFDAGPVPIFCSRELRGPVALGVRRPVLVLPEWFFSDISEQELASALCHELAHVRRRDFLLNLLYEILLLPISFHPAALLIKAQIKQSRELACDEMAAKMLPTPAIYARSLLSIAKLMAAIPSFTSPGSALGLCDTNTLEERIMNLLKEPNRLDKKWGRVQTLVASSLFVAASLAVSVFSIQIARAGSTPAELQQFTGTWEGKFKGKTFVTLKLAENNGKIGGTASRLSIQMSPTGELTDASPLAGEDDISETIPDGRILHVVTKAKGEVSTIAGESEESVQYDMKLIGPDQAELQIARVPPGMPAPMPWKLERKSVPK